MNAETYTCERCSATVKVDSKEVCPRAYFGQQHVKPGAKKSQPKKRGK